MPSLLLNTALSVSRTNSQAHFNAAAAASMGNSDREVGSRPSICTGSRMRVRVRLRAAGTRETSNGVA
ncbi:hypothetical protein M5689_014664 [Euphorbia peplus]|nr:hypothetical protein M5689_014664 [Euphorbia peplus]